MYPDAGPSMLLTLFRPLNAREARMDLLIALVHRVEAGTAVNEKGAAGHVHGEWAEKKQERVRYRLGWLEMPQWNCFGCAASIVGLGVPLVSGHAGGDNPGCDRVRADLMGRQLERNFESTISPRLSSRYTGRCLATAHPAPTRW